MMVLGWEYCRSIETGGVTALRGVAAEIQLFLVWILCIYVNDRVSDESDLQFYHPTFNQGEHAVTWSTNSSMEKLKSRLLKGMPSPQVSHFFCNKCLQLEFQTY